MSGLGSSFITLDHHHLFTCEASAGMSRVTVAPSRSHEGHDFWFGERSSDYAVVCIVVSGVSVTVRVLTCIDLSSDRWMIELLLSTRIVS